MSVNCFGPFSAEVWGTVSDWVMVIATVLTAIYLIRTFNSQRQVQFLQQSITDIEKERYRIEYQPSFEIIKIKVDNATIDSGIRSTIHFKLKLTKNEAKEVDIIGRSGTGNIKAITLSQNGIVSAMPIPIIHPESEFDLYFTVHPLMAVFRFEGGGFFFSLLFEDPIGNAYTQLYNVNFTDEILLSWKNPERIIRKSDKKSLFKQMISWFTRFYKN